MIADTETLLVPSIALFEVFKRVVVQRDEEAALYAVAHMQRARMVELDADLAIAAAALSAELGLPMADCIILATARRADATLWTQDADFFGLEGVEYRKHRRK